MPQGACFGTGFGSFVAICEKVLVFPSRFLSGSFIVFASNGIFLLRTKIGQASSLCPVVHIHVVSFVLTFGEHVLLLSFRVEKPVWVGCLCTETFYYEFVAVRCIPTSGISPHLHPSI